MTIRRRSRLFGQSTAQPMAQHFACDEFWVVVLLSTSVVPALVEMKTRHQLLASVFWALAEP